MLAQYMAVNNKIFNSMLKMNNEEIIDKIEELSENELCDICDVDKMWDGLHFLLTGKSASEPVENDKLSESVIGTSIFSEDDNDFLAYIKFEELPAIIEAMEKTDIDELLDRYDMEDFKNAKIYPNIWKKEDEADIHDELIFCFESLLDFYKKCNKKNMNIIISIY